MGAESISGTALESTVIAAKKSAAVLFWASWDAACRAYMPAFEQVDYEKGYNLSFFKCDVDSDQNTTTKFGVRCVPTVALFKAGTVSGRLAGAVTKTRLSTFVDSL